jgi:hypothetical protein
LKFTAATQTFSGTAPAKAQTLALKVTATDTSALSASETFAVSVAPGTSTGFSLEDWIAPEQSVPHPVSPIGNDLAGLQVLPFLSAGHDFLLHFGHL